MTNNMGGNLQPKGFPGLPSGWKTQWETIHGVCGKLRIFSLDHFQAEPHEGHRALVVFHGQGEHGGRYLHFPHFLKNEVDHVTCVDHRGHGRSEGVRGHVEAFDHYVSDAAMVVQRLHEKLMAQHGKAEIHVFGHSMGGLITLRLLFLHSQLPIQSAIISAPLLGLKLEVPIVKRIAGHALSKIWGSLQMETGLDHRKLSRDPAVQSIYTQDRLIHSKATSRFFVEMLAAMQDTVGRDHGISQPVLALIPTADEIVDSVVTENFFKSLKLSDKKIRKLDGYLHESFNDIGKEAVFEEMSHWIAQHHPST